MSKRTYEYVEGREAFERFRNAVKTVLSVPKSALPQKTKKAAKKTSVASQNRPFVATPKPAI